MERLVATLGRPLCSTLMVAEGLDIIAHVCRALAKLSDSNTTTQVRETTTGDRHNRQPLAALCCRNVVCDACVPGAQIQIVRCEKCGSVFGLMSRSFVSVLRENVKDDIPGADIRFIALSFQRPS